MATGPTAATNQFGNLACIRGFAPQQRQGPSPMPKSDRIPVSASSVLALFKNSPVYVSSGAVLSCVAGNTESVSGVVVEMFDSAGNVVYTVPATPTANAYYVTITTDPNQVFVARVNGTIYAESDINKFYNVNATEGATAGTDRFLAPGEMYSERYLEDESTSARQFISLGRYRCERNDAAGSAGTLIYCKINPVNFVVGG